MQKIEYELEVNHEKIVVASVLAAIAGVVAAVCKSRKKYTKVRTNKFSALDKSNSNAD